MLIRTSHWSVPTCFLRFAPGVSPLGVDSRWSLAGPTNLVTFIQRKSSAIHSPFSKEVLAKRVRGDLCCEGVFPPARNVWLLRYVRFSWHETFREHFCARLSQLFHLCTWRCILHAMRKRFQAWLEMRRFRKSFLWFFVAGVVFGEFGLCFEQIWTARGHRFVNICYFSACHDFAWQVQDSARFRMPQAHFSWEAKNSQNLMVLSCIVFHIFNVHVSWWMHNWFCGAVLILISLAQPSPHSVCVWKSWKDVERLPLIASLLVVWFIGFAVS